MSLYKKYSDLGEDPNTSNSGNMNDIQSIQSRQHKEGLISHNRVVVVNIHANWCGPCKECAPLFAELAGKYSNDCVFVKEDADSNFTPDCTGVPMFQVFLSGKLIESVLGADLKKVESVIVSAI
jgi:thiol-disulfide isomerase/thioredoxin